MEGRSGPESVAPPPFLVKTYEMVDDSSTNEIVSWSPTNNSFIVWDTVGFCHLLLPTYFTHNNFSSFIRQLNSYGFRKTNPQQWEFANDNFVRDQKHLLKNIRRKQPVYSHSHPPSSLMDLEMAAFEEQIQKLTQEKYAMESHIISFKQHQSAARLHLEDLMQRLDGMQRRQNNLLDFFEKALQNPNVVEHISHNIGMALDSLAYNKKRRFPYIDSNFIDNHNGYILEVENFFNEDFSNKFKEEMSPNVSDINLVLPRQQSSYDDGEIPYEMLFQSEPKGILTGSNLPFTPNDLLEIEDIGSPTATTGCESPKLHLLDPSSEEYDSHIPCLHTLTQASSPLKENGNSYFVESPQIDYQELEKLEELRIANDIESGGFTSSKRNIANGDANLVLSQAVSSNNQGNPSQVRTVNDEFWEKFFTD